MATPDPPWTAHRRRARALGERYPHATQVLGVYLALVDAWDDAWRECREERPAPAGLAAWAASRVVPRVVKATEASGPEPLVVGCREVSDPERPLAAWLAGEEQPPVERYLARASLYPALVALDEAAGDACRDVQVAPGLDPRDAASQGGRRCPRCGGPPQLTWRDASGEALVSARRRLLCARCGHGWAFSASACPSCGETAGAKRTVYGETHEGTVIGPSSEAPSTVEFPHLRVDACATCERAWRESSGGVDSRVQSADPRPA